MSDENRAPASATAVLCKCGKWPSRLLHTCPFRSDVHDDDKSLCDCCEDCTRECLYDI